MKAVLFDVDGVLLDSFEANLKFFQDLMQKSGHKGPTREEYSRLFHVSMLEIIKIYAHTDSIEEVQRIFAIGKSRQVPYPVELLRMPENAKKIIIDLSKKYILGIVSSRVRSSIFENPDMDNLRKYFKVVVCYEDTTKHKPEPDPLLYAIAKLGVNPSDTIYIGDNYTDIQAAKAAGMKIVFYSKYPDTEADACTSLFSKIPHIVENLFDK